MQLLRKGINIAEKVAVATDNPIDNLVIATLKAVLDAFDKTEV